MVIRARYNGSAIIEAWLHQGSRATRAHYLLDGQYDSVLVLLDGVELPQIGDDEREHVRARLRLVHLLEQSLRVYSEAASTQVSSTQHVRKV